MSQNGFSIGNALLSIFQRIWFVWCAIVFTITGLVSVFFYFFIFNFAPEKKAFKYTFFITKCWGRSLLAFMFIRTRVEGMEKLDKKKTYVLVSNHCSATDIPICVASAPVSMSFLAKIEVDKIPLVGYLARNMHVYVDRKSSKGRSESFQRMRDHLAAGRSIHIYPEGTRNKTDQALKKFHNGAFRLAIETQTPVAVMTVINSKNIIEEGYRITPSSVQTYWEEPIETKGMTLDDIDYLKSLVRKKILNRIHSVQTASETI